MHERARGHAAAGTAATGTAAEVLRAFLRLGVSAFGGPVAHIGYFRREFVERRRWLGEEQFAELVGLCQFLPGPTSSQVGFAIGLVRAGAWGGLAAWTGFTLPSAFILYLFALYARHLSASGVGHGALHGLQIAAVAIVAQAVWSMARTLCPDSRRAGLAIVATVIATLAPASVGQLLAIGLGLAAGVILCREGVVTGGNQAPAVVITRRTGVLCLGIFALQLIVALLGSGMAPPAAALAAFYRAGALVFGGGHVVLPLLHEGIAGPGWTSDAAFLAGYGAAQAVPGPLFTFAAYLGAILPFAPSPAGAALALVAIFLPGLLVLVGILPFWAELRARPNAQAAVRGLNAAVVGLLGAALYDPIFTTAIREPADFALAVACAGLLMVWRTPPLLVVAGGALVGATLLPAH